mgnify:CR=1 FL=1
MPYVGTNGKWYVGYGLECDPADYPAGISPEEAERLLREHLFQDEASLSSKDKSLHSQILKENSTTVYHNQPSKGSPCFLWPPSRIRLPRPPRS